WGLDVDQLTSLQYGPQQRPLDVSQAKLRNEEFAPDLLLKARFVVQADSEIGRRKLQCLRCGVNRVGKRCVLLRLRLVRKLRRLAGRSDRAEQNPGTSVSDVGSVA